nr:PRD domain-containing protein [Enterococcus sp. DIV2402]
MIINEIESIIQALEKRYNTNFKNFIRVNLFLHLSSMIERILVGDFVKDESDQIISADLTRFIDIADELFEPIKQKYNIEIPKREYDYIFKILAFEK